MRSSLRLYAEAVAYVRIVGKKNKHEHTLSTSRSEEKANVIHTSGTTNCCP